MVAVDASIEIWSIKCMLEHYMKSFLKREDLRGGKKNTPSILRHVSIWLVTLVKVNKARLLGWHQRRLLKYQGRREGLFCHLFILLELSQWNPWWNVSEIAHSKPSVALWPLHMLVLTEEAHGFPSSSVFLSCLFCRQEFCNSPVETSCLKSCHTEQVGYE